MASATSDKVTPAPAPAAQPAPKAKPTPAAQTTPAAQLASQPAPAAQPAPQGRSNQVNPLLQVGAHVITPRVGFTHHGLYIGHGQVLEYIKSQGVVIVPLATFTQGHELFIREHKNARFKGAEAVRRGMMRLGEQHYNLLTRNCEHFVNWCIEGVETSRQIDNLILTIIPFYSLFQQSNFVQGCLRIIYDDPHSLEKALARVDWHNARSQNPVTRAQELSEDIFGTKNEGVVHFATLFTTAAQLSSEYSAWLTAQKAQEQPARATVPAPRPSKWHQFTAKLNQLTAKLRDKLRSLLIGLPLLLEILPGKRATNAIPNIHIKLDPKEVQATVATAAHSVSYHAPYQRPITRAQANELACHVADQIEQELRAQYELRNEDEPPK